MKWACWLQVDEFIDNLNRPTRQKIKNLATEPVFRFISPSMRAALALALQRELQDVSEACACLHSC
jgi:hypothetical protein